MNMHCVGIESPAFMVRNSHGDISAVNTRMTGKSRFEVQE
jgi:hypothetical protein